MKYQHEALQSILEPTYGIGVYQEQVLQIAQVFAGFTLGKRISCVAPSEKN